MAYCPECKAAMPMAATSCDACGFEFPPSAENPDKNGWEYTDFAEGTLIVGAFCSSLAAIGLGLFAIAALLHRQYLTGLLGIVQAIVSLALCVVFLRVRK